MLFSNFPLETNHFWGIRIYGNLHMGVLQPTLEIWGPSSVVHRMLKTPLS